MTVNPELVDVIESVQRRPQLKAYQRSHLEILVEDDDFQLILDLAAELDMRQATLRRGGRVVVKYPSRALQWIVENLAIERGPG